MRTLNRPTSPTSTPTRRLSAGTIFTPPRELQAAISSALRATGKLDDFEVAALVHAGVMRKMHLRHSRYQKEAACGQPYPTLLTDDRDRVTCGRVWPRRQGISVGGRIRLTRAGPPGGPPGRPPRVQRYCATAPRSAVAPAE